VSTGHEILGVNNSKSTWAPSSRIQDSTWNVTLDCQVTTPYRHSLQTSCRRISLLSLQSEGSSTGNVGVVWTSVIILAPRVLSVGFCGVGTPKCHSSIKPESNAPCNAGFSAVSTSFDLPATPSSRACCDSVNEDAHGPT